MARHFAPRPVHASRRRPLLVVLLTLGLMGVASAAFAYWTAQGHGTGSAKVATLAAPTGVTATSTAGSTTVSVSWTASSGSPTPQGYYVVRTNTSTSATAPACGTSATTLTTTTTCSDTSVPDGSYTYAVTAVYRSWTAKSAASASVTVAAQVASKLAFTTQPSANATSQSPFAQQPVVTVQTASGATVTNDSSTVSLTLTTPNGAVLACTTGNSRAAINGVATFTGCQIDKSGTYTLTATDGSLTSATSTTITVAAGPAAKMLFTTQPGNGTGGSPLSAQPAVTVQDNFGNTVTTDGSSIALALTTPGGATLSCTANPTTAVSGVATFSGCSVNKTGTYTLTATRSGLSPATSSNFTVTVGSAAKLAFTTQPSSSATSQTAFATQPVVTIQDLGGNTVTGSNATVTLGLTNAPAGATLTCTTNPVNATSGVATFAGCRIDKAGSSTLTATSGSLSAATSIQVTVNAGAASKLAFTDSAGVPGCPTGTKTVGNNASYETWISALDNAGNLASVTLTTVNISKGSGNGQPPSPATLIIPAGSATTSGSTVISVPNGNGSDTYTATAGGLTASCIVKK